MKLGCACLKNVLTFCPIDLTFHYFILLVFQKHQFCVKLSLPEEVIFFGLMFCLPLNLAIFCVG